VQMGATAKIDRLRKYDWERVDFHRGSEMEFLEGACTSLHYSRGESSDGEKSVVVEIIFTNC